MKKWKKWTFFFFFFLIPDMVVYGKKWKGLYLRKKWTFLILDACSKHPRTRSIFLTRKFFFHFLLPHVSFFMRWAQGKSRHRSRLKKKKKKKNWKKNSKAGNWTRVSCVTGRNTSHYTTSDGLTQFTTWKRIGAEV